jgi:NADPH:quinone reductase-like Zn-dependent oxidoreductase
LKIIGWDASYEELMLPRLAMKSGMQAISRQGAYAQYQIVDERIVGTKPSSLSMLKLLYH